MNKIAKKCIKYLTIRRARVQDTSRLLAKEARSGDLATGHLVSNKFEGDYFFIKNNHEKNR